MVIHIIENEAQIGKAAAMIFAAQIIKKPDCVLGFATGSTPLPAYRELIKLHERGILNFSKVRSFNLDEYVGIGRDHEQSYYCFMYDNLFSRLNIEPENVRVPDPVSADPNEDCAAYEAAIEEAGGIDLQILGIGHNGHIAFNEPGGAFSSKTHIVELTQSTIEANQRFFSSINEVPKKAMSMGIQTIMKARDIVLVAAGAPKAEAVRAMVKGPVDPACPASILQFHPSVTILLDESAASLL